MAEINKLSEFIDSYVDASRSMNQQAASVDSIASLVKKDVVPIETLVREMDMYLTTEDNVIRARGILLLGKVLESLASKTMNDATIRCLIQFFTERLADWRALRGALVGCLALTRRKNSVGMVTTTDAKALAEFYFRNVHVQALGQYDRKLCFELMECLLECHSDAVASLDDHLVIGLCAAIDEEKDPQCLMSVFHIVELLACLFPDPCGVLAGFASELFEVISCYFPIHFTHTKDEEADIKRDDLSRALMRAFSSTPIFEPFVIPLFLEKLSSSLPVAKVDSLKYLRNCTLKYGADRMANHSDAIWSSLKETIYMSHESGFSFALESRDGRSFQEKELAVESLNLLQALVKHNASFSRVVIDDVDINKIFNTIASYKCYDEISLQSKQKLHAVSQIIHVSAKASNASCNEIYRSFFPRLMDALGLSVKSSSGDCSPIENFCISNGFNHGALLLCVELLAASRELTLEFEESPMVYDLEVNTWCYLVKSFSVVLAQAFSSFATSNKKDARDVDIFLQVKGLQILCTFYRSYQLMPRSTFETILSRLLFIVTEGYDSRNIFAWKLALKALVHVGSFINQSQESEKELSYMSIVVERVVSLVSLGNTGVPFSLKLEAITEIGISGHTYMLKVVQDLGEALCAQLIEVYVHGDSKSIETAVQIFRCFSNNLLPRIHSFGNLDDILLQFSLNIWNQIENCMSFNVKIHEKGLLDEAMMAMKLIVSSCSLESQNKIIQKSYGVFSLNTPQLSNSMPSTLISLEALDFNLSSKDEWIQSLFASEIIAVRPEASIPNIKSLWHLFMMAFVKGHVCAAQALSSIANKMDLNTNGSKLATNFTLEEAMDITFNTPIWSSHDINGGMNCSIDVNLTKLCSGITQFTSFQVNAITGLAWIGKGLLMRGHEKVRDATMIFLESLQSSGEKNMSVMKCAADAFQILMCDSEDCLNRKFNAVIRPLYKQRFFSTMMPIMQSLTLKSVSSHPRPMLYRAFAHIVSNTPLIVILSHANKLIPIMMDALLALSNEILDKDVMYDLLLVLSGILTDKNEQEAVKESAHLIINCLVGLIGYRHMMLVRKTAIQCLVAMSVLPHVRIYPLRAQVLQAISKALDDPKRTVRQEAVRCRQAWASIASRSLQF